MLQGAARETEETCTFTVPDKIVIEYPLPVPKDPEPET